jgi:CRISPR-associated protein Cas5d
VKLFISGQLACFSRPELSVERVSYDAMTPSAAVGVLEAIYWKPAIQWNIDRITVLRPIRHTQFKRNEISICASANRSSPAWVTTRVLNVSSFKLRVVHG